MIYDKINITLQISLAARPRYITRVVSEGLLHSQR